MRPRVLPLLVVSTLLLAGPVRAADPKPSWQATRLSASLYELQTDGGGYTVKVLASVGPDGVLLVDSGQRRAAQSLLDTLRQLGGGTPRIIINSHSHQEHVAGNLGLGRGSLIIGHTRLRERLQQDTYMFAGYDEDTLPRLTVDDELTVRFNGETVRVKAFAGAHDDCDLVVHFGTSNVAFVGALVTACKFPSVDSEGDVLSYPDVAQRVLDWLPDDVRLVPGHTTDATVAQGRQFVDMLRTTTALVRAELAKGKNLEAMQKEDLLRDWAAWEVSFVTRNDWLAYLVQGLTRQARPASPRQTVHVPLHAALVKGGPAAVAPAYDGLRASPAYQVDEIVMAEIGYVLYTSDQLREAIPFFELSARDYPRGTYGALSQALLGVIHQRLGGATQAAVHFRKALEVDPENARARRGLEELARPGTEPASGPAAADRARLRVPQLACRGVMIDGRFGPDEWQGASEVEIGEGASLRVMRLGGEVFFGLKVADASRFRIADLFVAPEGAAPVQLHASAQIGEAPVRDGESEPTFRWGRSDGWTASEVRWDAAEMQRLIAAGRTRDEAQLATIYPHDGFEYQISRARFPGRSWWVRVEIFRSRPGQDGSTTVWPEGASRHDTAGWAELVLDD